jgi:hypothetical protein
MLVSQKLAIAAHVHVLLRRKTGRVTDTEWMASNLEYALEIVRFTRAKVIEEGHVELAEWADKLERAVLEPTPGHKPVAQTAMHLLKASTAQAPLKPPQPAPVGRTSGFNHSAPFGDTGFSESVLEQGKPVRPRDTNVPRYIGGIR